MYLKAVIRLLNGGRMFSDVVLVDTGATGIIIDESVAEGLRVFGETEIAALGTVVKCALPTLATS